VSGLTDRLASAGYALGWSAVCKLPEPWAKSAFQTVADIAWRRQGPQVQVLEANLRRVLGPDADGAQLRALSRDAMRSYAQYWLEVFRLPVIPTERLLAEATYNENLDAALDVLATGRGVVFGLPHMGNWDAAGAWVIAKGAGSLTTVQERLKPESLFDQFVAFREGLGFEVLAASGSAVSVFGTLTDRLRAGKLVCLVADRDVTGTGTEVDFFGEKARMMGGSAALAERTGAALFPAVLWHEDGRLAIQVGEEIPVPAEGNRKHKVAEMTQQMARYFEAGIREHPADWHMLQRVFTADLDPERLARAAATASGPGADDADDEAPRLPGADDEAAGGPGADDEAAGGPGANAGRAAGRR
jgi:phosphatidylinositol dimannoside acyltransferase